MFDTISSDTLTTVVGGQACQCCGQEIPGQQDPNAGGGDPRAMMQQPGGGDPQAQPGGGDPNQGAPGGPQGGGFDWRKIVNLIGGFMQQFAAQA